MKPAQPVHVKLRELEGSLIFQPKINGIRAYLDDGELKTRNGRVITCIPHILKELKPLAHWQLDGELYSEEMSFQALNGLVRRKNPAPEHNSIKFHVFDIMNEDNQDKRLRLAHSLIRNLKHVKPVPTYHEGQADNLYKQFLNDKYEGLIARDPSAYYGTGLYKIKPVFDSEFKVLSIDHNILTLETSEGKTFKLDQYNNDCKPGNSVTVEYSMLTDEGIPFHGRVKSPRYDLPEAKPDFTYETEETTDTGLDNLFTVIGWILKITIGIIVMFFTFCFALLGMLLN